MTTNPNHVTKEEAEVRDAAWAAHCATQASMTPAQKAAITRRANKAWAAHDLRMAPVHAKYHGFCETFYPERNAAIDAAEEEMRNAIEAAKAKFSMTRKRIMAEFEEATREAREEHDAFQKTSFAQVKVEGGMN